eukprot:6369966-Amphidinium_carterae.1
MGHPTSVFQDFGLDDLTHPALAGMADLTIASSVVLTFTNDGCAKLAKHQIPGTLKPVAALTKLWQALLSSEDADKHGQRNTKRLTAMTSVIQHP